jgi:small conductance mechanosensitive channel
MSEVPPNHLFRRWAYSATLIAVLTTPTALVGQAAQTTSDPTIESDHLNLMVTPLRRDQLAVEAEAWLVMVQAKATEVSQVEIDARTSEGEAQTALLEQAAELRIERDALAERTTVVLTEWERKGGDPEEYTSYLAAVSGVEVDVTDSNALWTTVRVWITSPEGGVRWITRLLLFMVTLVVARIVAGMLSGLVRKSLERFGKGSDLLRDFFVKITRQFTMLIGLVIAMSLLGFQIGPLLAAMGAAGFIIGFALQGTLSNFASGIMLLMYRPFDIGDAVEVAGVTGVVESMSLVSTTINTFDNRMVVIPNNSIWGGVITNITGNDTRRVDMVFGIGYSDDIGKASRILHEVIEAHEKVLADPVPVIKVHELADSSVNFVVRPWAQTGDYWDVYWDVTRKVKERFDTEGVSIPFPQRDVHLHQETGV